jgi:signal transduction histidine kinase
VVDSHIETCRQTETLMPDVHLGELPVVRGDAARLRQVFDNLVGNAIKYTEPGAPAVVSITSAAVPDGSVEIQVADRGIGIPSGQHETIFTPFHRAHGGSYAGTGLGLAICHRIITRHGGSISARPNRGGGTRFAFSLCPAREAANV